MTFEASTEMLADGQIVRYFLFEAGLVLTFGQVLDLLRTDRAFRTDMTTLLAASDFTAFRWETPPITSHATNRQFEFVLINAPEFATRRTDSQAFQQYFTTDDTNQGVVAFTNLRQDATLIVPSPRVSGAAYGHFAAFLRHAPELQIDALWRVIADTLTQQLGTKPLWLSTAGAGVPWLHVRIDSAPKYYWFDLYKAAVSGENLDLQMS